MLRNPKDHLINQLSKNNLPQDQQDSNQSRSRKLRTLAAFLVIGFMVIGLSGCQTDQFANLDAAPEKAEPQVLREGDVVRIVFPGAPNLSAVQQIRRDGKIALQMAGEFQAAGLTPAAMEKELLKLYGPQLQLKEVTVTVESSVFPVYVTGAVLRPGKILADRPLTALEAVMEAGGFDYSKANLKAVNIVRHENGKTEHFKLNLKGVLQGEATEQFKLKPSDIVYVPERFQWF